MNQDERRAILRALRERLFDPGAFAAFCAGFTAEMELQRRERLAERKTAQRELAAVERKQREILKALSDGYRSEAWKAELLTLDDRKASLTALLAEPQLPALHPNMAEVFRQRRRHSRQDWNTTTSAMLRVRRSVSSSSRSSSHRGTSC